MRRRLTAAAALAALMAVTGFAGAGTASDLKDSYSHAYYGVAHQLGRDVPGRNIRRHGLAGGRRATRADFKRSLATLQAMLRPAATRATVPGVQTARTDAPTAAAGGGAGGSTVQCESGGNYAANTGNGYYGGYQFDSQTWDAYGDPRYPEASSAPPSVQDEAAASVPYDAWPNC